MPVIKLRGLPWSCTPEDVEKFLNGINIILKQSYEPYDQNDFEDDKTMKPAIYLTTNPEGRPSGEAFIELVDENDLDMALKRNNALMGQRYIEVFRSNPEQLNKHLKESASNASNWSDPVVRLRGLPYGCTKQDIIHFFNGLNISYDGIMMVIDFSGRFNGEAFVQFVDIINAYKALDRHKQKIANRYIEIFRSTFDEMSYYSSNSNNSRLNNNSKSFNKLNKKNSLINSFDSPANKTRSSFINDFNNRNRSKPYSRNFCTQSKQKSFNNSNLPSLMSTNSYSYACEDNNQDFTNNSMNTYISNEYSSPSFNDNDNYLDRTTHGVKMRGLPYSVTENEIRNFFLPLEPTNVILSIGRDGRPNGECECDFATHNEACEAMKYDKKFIGNRYIELFLLSGSSKSQTALTFGSLMSKDFGTKNVNNINYNKNSGSNNKSVFNDFNSNNYTSFEKNTNNNSLSQLPLPPPQQSKVQSILGPLPSNPSIPSQFSSTNINEMIFADMAKQMTQLYNQFNQFQQQQHFNNNNNNNSINSSTQKINSNGLSINRRFLN